MKRLILLHSSKGANDPRVDNVLGSGPRSSADDIAHSLSNNDNNSSTYWKRNRCCWFGGAGIARSFISYTNTKLMVVRVLRIAQVMYNKFVGVAILGEDKFTIGTCKSQTYTRCTNNEIKVTLLRKTKPRKHQSQAVRKGAVHRFVHKVSICS